MVRLTRFIFFMNLCEKSAVSFNEYGGFCSLRMTMFFAEVEKDFSSRFLEGRMNLSRERISVLHSVQKQT